MIFFLYINLKKATTDIKIQQTLSSLGLSDVWIYFRDGTIASDIGIVKFHPSKGAHWVAYINETFFKSYNCVCPKKLSKFIIKHTDFVYILKTKYKVWQKKRYSFCGGYCFYIIYLTKVVGIDFKFLNLLFWNHTIKWSNNIDIFFKKMTLGKKTNDNSVRYILPTKSSQSEKSDDHKPKTVSSPRKQK